jgi:hypothetical protein
LYKAPKKKPIRAANKKYTPMLPGTKTKQKLTPTTTTVGIKNLYLKNIFLIEF